MSLNEVDAAFIAHEVVTSIMRHVAAGTHEKEEDAVDEDANDKEEAVEEDGVEEEAVEEDVVEEEAVEEDGVEEDGVEEDGVEEDGVEEEAVEEAVEEDGVEEEAIEENVIEEDRVEEEVNPGADMGLTTDETCADANAEAATDTDAQANSKEPIKPTFPPLTETWQTTLRYIMATSIFLLWLLACKRTWINNVDKLLCTWLLAMAVVLFQACLHKRADMLSVVHFGFLAYLLIAPFVVTSWMGRTLCTLLHALQYYVYFANGYRWPLSQWVPRHSKMMAWLKPFQGMYMDMVVASVRTMLLYVTWIGAGKRTHV